MPAEAQATLDGLFASGARVVAVASRAVTLDRLGRDDERDLSLDGFLCFTDPAKPDVHESLARLARLGIAVKIVTGDNGAVAAHLCREVGLDPGEVAHRERARGDGRRRRCSRCCRRRRSSRASRRSRSRASSARSAALGADVGFLGDGVNDAIALHDADVGISVDSAADVAKDAADVVLLDKDLGIIADGVVEGRRIFANTIKYVLMGTSSNFGNMFSAAGASLFLSFLPMLPTQILLNNLLYDVSEMTIPTDNVDEELLARPSQWDIGLIRRFMAFFGPISSAYDFLTFAVMLRVFDAGATPVPVRLVRRVAHHPDARHLRDPHPPRALLQEPAQPAAARRHPRLRRARSRDPVHRPARAPLRLPGRCRSRSSPSSPCMIVTYLALAQLGVALFFQPQGGRSLARAIGRRERRIMRTASRWRSWRHHAHRGACYPRERLDRARPVLSDPRADPAQPCGGGTITIGHGL